MKSETKKQVIKGQELAEQWLIAQGMSAEEVARLTPEQILVKILFWEAK